MIYNKTNIKNADFSALSSYKIKIIGESNRRGSNKTFKGQPNCSGYNINQHIRDGMTVAQYQAMIKNTFSEADPQFHLTKHLKYDIEQGTLELHS